MRLDNKVAIVTGAGSGIGKETALKLATEGAKVVLAEIREDYANEVAKEIGDKSFPIKVDVTKEEDVKRMVEETLRRFGTIDILISNAGIHGEMKPIDRMEVKEWDKIHEVHMKGTFLTCREVSKIMMEKRYGKIVTISSVGVKLRHPLNLPYVAGKGGIEAFTRSLAVYLGPYNINVNCIAPGFIVTPMWKDLGGEDGEFAKSILPLIPLGRKGYPKDIANVVAFLVSEEASYITGQIIHVNGGLV